MNKMRLSQAGLFAFKRLLKKEVIKQLKQPCSETGPIQLIYNSFYPFTRKCT